MDTESDGERRKSCASSGHQRWRKLGQDGSLSPFFNIETIFQLMGRVSLTRHSKTKTLGPGAEGNCGGWAGEVRAIGLAF